MSKKTFYLLSFTWGLPMTLLGCLVAAVLVCAGYKPKRFGWCWYFEIGEDWGGLELGMFFLKCRSGGDYILRHEHGHAIQNCFLGVLMPFAVCIPSSVRYWYRRIVRKFNRHAKLPDYDSIWFEGDATMLGDCFATEHGW